MQLIHRIVQGAVFSRALSLIILPLRFRFFCWLSLIRLLGKDIKQQPLSPALPRQPFASQPVLTRAPGSIYLPAVTDA